jgi:hypothetical protein
MPHVPSCIRYGCIKESVFCEGAAATEAALVAEFGDKSILYFWIISAAIPIRFFVEPPGYIALNTTSDFIDDCGANGLLRVLRFFIGSRCLLYSLLQIGVWRNIYFGGGNLQHVLPGLIAPS